MSEAGKYTYRVAWSEEDEAYVGMVAELPSLSVVEESFDEAFQGIRALAEVVVEDLRASDERVPTPLSIKDYSGKFMVRVPAEVHRELAIEAAEQHVSMNQLVTSRLSVHC